jgi:hypothetical protein
MAETIHVIVIGDDLIRNALVGKDNGGAHLRQGLAEVVADTYSGCTVDVAFAHGEGVSTLLAELQDPSIDDPLSLANNRCDVVIISTTNDVHGLADLAQDPNDAIEIFSNDLVSVIDLIKERTNAHVLVSNAATFDPLVAPASLYGIDGEPVSLRAHRVDLTLLKLSHLLGVSLIDVDRVTAEAGASVVVPAALELNQDGSQLVRDETIRVLDDYGFFDGRQLAPQIGNRKEST